MPKNLLNFPLPAYIRQSGTNLANSSYVYTLKICLGEFGLRSVIPLHGSLPVPLRCFSVVPRNAIPIGVQYPEIILGRAMALLSGFAAP